MSTLFELLSAPPTAIVLGCSAWALAWVRFRRAPAKVRVREPRDRR